MRRAMLTATSVSYTHLDVYKRQVLLAVYLYGVRTMSADDGVSNSDDGASSQLSMKQIIFRCV